jgi:hypothetical protein
MKVAPGSASPTQKKCRGKKVKCEKSEEDGSSIKDVEENLSPDDMTVPPSEKLYCTVDGPEANNHQSGNNGDRDA